MFNLANSIWSIELKQPLLTLIIRAKKNCVAYYQAEKPKEKKPGRPAEYGKKVILMQLFDQPELFSKMPCHVYGKIEEISILTLNLLWKPTGDMIRFVLAVTSRGPIVLMCSDLNQDPLIAIRLYCIRTRIEVMFDILKNLIGAFHYRFWSKQMPHHSRKPKKNKDLKMPSKGSLANVELCWHAYERFVILGSIALCVEHDTASHVLPVETVELALEHVVPERVSVRVSTQQGGEQRDRARRPLRCFNCE